MRVYCATIFWYTALATLIEMILWPTDFYISTEKCALISFKGFFDYILGIETG